MALAKVTTTNFTTGPISFSEIRRIYVENLDSQVKASQLYRNTNSSDENPIVPDATENENIPTSGAIRFSRFRNSVKSITVEQTGQDIEFKTNNLNLVSNLFGAANISKNVRKNLLVKGTVGSNNHTVPALDHNLSYNNFFITVDTTGKIYGAGGLGGSVNSGSGTSGGTAFRGQFKVRLTNNGQIWAGGGGGGGGGRGGNGGKGGNGSYEDLVQQTCTTPSTTETQTLIFNGSYTITDFYPDVPGQNNNRTITNISSPVGKDYVNVTANIDDVSGECRPSGSRFYTHTLVSVPSGGTYVPNSFVITSLSNVSKISASNIDYSPEGLRSQIIKLSSNSYRLQFFTKDNCNSFCRQYTVNYTFRYEVNNLIPGTEYDCSYPITKTSEGGNGGTGANGGTGGRGRGFNYQTGTLLGSFGLSGSPGLPGGVNAGDGGNGGDGGRGCIGGDWGEPGSISAGIFPASGSTGGTGQSGFSITTGQLILGSSGSVGNPPGAPGQSGLAIDNISGNVIVLKIGDIKPL